LKKKIAYSLLTCGFLARFAGLSSHPADSRGEPNQLAGAKKLRKNFAFNAQKATIVHRVVV
jgi:hypothetical protein